MKNYCLATCFFFISLVSFSQTDTIYSNNEKIACSVKEILPDAVKYVFPGEDLINTIYKNTVQKIVFKSGRVQTFSESTSYKKVQSVFDYENVTVTQVESEIKGLYKAGDVSSKAKGTTTLSNQERVKERAYRKLKIQAAMLGSNIVYLTDQRTEGNKAGSYYQAGSSAETNLTGIAYTNTLPSYQEFLNIINNRKIFTTLKEISLWSSSSDFSEKNYNTQFTIFNINNENGLIQIDGQIDGVSKYKKFRVVNFSKDSFTIFYEDKSTAYNVIIRL
jgi:hypothetical protein